ncbi:MAG: bifunctional phosphoribosyl-AMP cyclohydrolase/phosphoribosyl-ATP diphosphatase HisIE [Myxococcales bacterium]|nr:bifunctional phosphoribosyl-AMP cyclohydrolase/phosphoribosyl-ATP diphosphatase HisIE [Myxococcales bacterium]MBK7191824.1 bifunctional phosphoribosyl-AMP cyclohydrolase/phosphoribosyl-ATP diphosphatase HisIE [Myxococcales bacterium]MBP6842489.1 bifunctional phosphoribosyl-AMP cyclohydrolase/phosphoribosyl-ATP diphosphatase HisIE [Kofleriaceae bacterium]
MPLPEPKWDDRGLVPAVVQDADRGTVLMLAWMNHDAWRLTNETGTVHFWSRSRQALWKKGETSGHVLRVSEVRIDCDHDAVLVRARPDGPTCHTGATACFFHRDGGDDDDGAPAAHIVDRLAAVIAARKAAVGARSYTRSLLDGGLPKILGKIAEEHGELAAELTAPTIDPHKVVHETADLLFHVIVGLAACDVPVADVWQELGRRFGVSGLDEKAARAPKA